VETAKLPELKIRAIRAAIELKLSKLSKHASCVCPDCRRRDRLTAQLAAIDRQLFERKQGKLWS